MKPDSSPREILAFLACTSAAQWGGLSVSLLFGTGPSACIGRDCEQWSPSTHQYCGGSHPITDWTFMRNHWGNFLQILQPAASVLPSWRTGLLFSVWTLWILCRCGFSPCLWEAGINFQPKIVVCNSVFQSSHWLYYSLYLVFLLGFSQVFHLMLLFPMCFLINLQSSW